VIRLQVTWLPSGATSIRLWSRDVRSALRSMAASAGASWEIVYLPVEREVQWRRLHYRWKHTPEQRFPMAEAELDPWRKQFEVPDADELSGSSLPSPPLGDVSWLGYVAVRHGRLSALKILRLTHICVSRK
jgi:hypothetical protein